MSESTFETQNVQSEVSPTESSSPAPAAEKLVSMPQSHFDEIVKSAKAGAAQKERARYESERNQQSNANSTSPTTPAYDESKLDSLVADKVEWKLQEIERSAYERAQYDSGKKIADEFIGKLHAGAASYSDFDAKIGRLDFAKIPDIVRYANQVGNTADVMYELASNPSKLAVLRQMSHPDSGIKPEAVIEEIQLLSKSIELNQKAQNTKLANAPLTQIQPTSIGIDNGAAQTVSDFRKIFRSRK